MSMQNLLAQVDLEKEQRFNELHGRAISILRMADDLLKTVREFRPSESACDCDNVETRTIDESTVNALKELCEIYYDGTGESREWNANRLSELMRQVATWMDSLKLVPETSHDPVVGELGDQAKKAAEQESFVAVPAGGSDHMPF